VEESGITGHEVTSLHRETGREIGVPEVAWRAAAHFADVFGRRVVREGEGEAAA